MVPQILSMSILPSEDLARKAIVLPTIVMRGTIPNFFADFSKCGSTKRASKMVENTLTVRFISLPSTSIHFPYATAAFSTKPSTRSSSLPTLFANAATESYDERSICHTWITPCRFVSVSMAVLASSPLLRFRTARMTRAEPSRTRCFAHSNPRPLFAPVTMYVFPWQS